MKKLVILLAITACLSCVSSGPFKQDLGGDRVALKASGGEAVINVFRQVDMSGDTVLDSLAPGTVVKLLKKNSSAALVQTPNGKTGWIDIKYLPGE